MLDLIADLSVKDICERHDCTRHWVYKVSKDNQKRIEAEKNKFTEERQREIKAAFQRDVERTTQAIELSGIGMLDAVGELISQINDSKMSKKERREACIALGVKWEKLREYVEKKKRG